MQNPSTKHWQWKFSNSATYQRGSYTMTNWNLYQECKISLSCGNQSIWCILLIEKWTPTKKSHDHLHRQKSHLAKPTLKLNILLQSKHQPRIEGNFLNLMKTIYEKSTTAYLMIETDSYPPNTRKKRQGCLLLQLIPHCARGSNLASGRKNKQKKLK